MQFTPQTSSPFPANLRSRFPIKTSEVFRKMLGRLLDLFILGVGISSLFGFLGRLNWHLDLFSHFRVQYLVLHAIALLIALGMKKYKTVILAVGFVIFHLWFVLPFYIPKKPVDAVNSSYQILLSNVHTSNSEFDKVREVIGSTNPDIIFLLETNQRWLDALSLQNLGYPYMVTAPREDNFGLAIYSRLPFTQSNVIDFGGDGYYSIVVELQLEDKSITLIETHPPPPVGDGAARRRNRQLTEVAEFISNQAGSIILLGDLNITTWSPFFADTIGKINLYDSRLGFGIQPTWSMYRPFFLRIPIDHIFTTENIVVLNRETGPDIGSDHLPVILDFTIP